MGFLDRRGLPEVDYAALTQAVGARVRVIAWGRGEDGPVVGLTDRLAIAPAAGADGWTFVAWDSIERGGWDPKNRRLHWTGDGLEGSVTLSEPGQLPEFFRERVEASILLERVLETGVGSKVTISARRNPGAPDSPLSWQVKPGLATLDGAARRVVEAELARLRTEYDISGSIW